MSAAAEVEQIAYTAPTDRSTPPTAITIVMPMAMIPSREICRVIFRKLLTVKNTLLVTEKMKIIAISTNRMPSSRIFTILCKTVFDCVARIKIPLLFSEKGPAISIDSPF